MSTRVIAGSAKGQRLKLVPGDSTRPIMDKVKEALFSIIGQDIVDARFLDLFGGTGAVGIEALSRGAEFALFVELNRTAANTIRENLQQTRFTARAEVRLANALELLKQAPAGEFDYIYVAPPQYKGIWLEVLKQLDANPRWLGANTIVIVQIDPSEQVDVLCKHLRPYDLRKYGRTLLWFFETVVEE
jgi:16S rRNA (guanine(966)-N(2))-methyltransferase RsmD